MVSQERVKSALFGPAGSPNHWSSLCAFGGQAFLRSGFLDQLISPALCSRQPDKLEAIGAAASQGCNPTLVTGSSADWLTLWRLASPSFNPCRLTFLAARQRERPGTRAALTSPAGANRPAAARYFTGPTATTPACICACWLFAVGATPPLLHVSGVCIPRCCFQMLIDEWILQLQLKRAAIL